MGAVSGDINTLSLSCLDAADLASRPVAALEDGDIAFVQSLRSYFAINRTSTTAANGVTIITTPTGVGRWFRLEIIDPSWAQQADWYIDAVNGSDQNPGTQALPLQSWAEFHRRVTFLTQSTTVHLVGDFSEPIVGQFGGAPDAIGQPPTLTIEGTVTVLDSGVITTSADPDPAANAEGTLTSVDIPAWTAGAIVEADDGAGRLAWAPVLADVAGTAQVPFWASVSAVGTPSHPLPAPGEAIRMFNCSAVNSRVNLQSAAPFEVLIVLRYLNFTSGPNTIDSFCSLQACQINGGFGDWGRAFFFGTAFVSGGIEGHGPTGVTFYGGIALGNLSFGRTGYVAFDGFISYKTLTIGATLVGDSWVGAQIVAGGRGLGVFNATGAGVVVTKGGRLNIPNQVHSLYGDGNVGVGLLVGDGGVVQIDTITPTIVGTVQEIALDGQATCVPPLTAADLAVPAAAALATWAQWAAAPFNRVAVNYAFTAAGVGAASMARIVGT